VTVEHIREAREGMTNYPEAFPHVLLQAFLQRVTNGEGRIEREYAAGRGRMDLAVEYHGSWEGRLFLMKDKDVTVVGC
jgi:hypothetical protein